MATFKKPSKTIKNVTVKGYAAKTKNGEVSFHKQSTRKMEVNVDNNGAKKYPQITSNLNNSMRDGAVTKMADLHGDKGVTPGVKKVTMKDASGKTVKGYFKDVDNEPFMYGGGLLRRTVTLNDKFTNESFTNGSDYRNLKNDKDHSRDVAKGHMMDREVATYSLAKGLGMDHLPEASVRRLTEDGKDDKSGRLGIMIRDIHDQFGEKGAKIVKGHEAGGFSELAKTDKKLADKLAFDLLIGNTDRHGNNFFTKTHSDGRQEMLAFDQGLSFPNNNKNYTSRDFFNQESFLRNAGDMELTPNFIENFTNFISSDGFDNLTEYIKDNIGKNESNAFIERVAFITSAIYGRHETKVGSMGFRSHNQSK